MNALWISRLSQYQSSRLRVASAREIIATKISRQRALLARYRITLRASNIAQKNTISHILLEEARSSKTYWRHFRDLLPRSYRSFHRQPRAKDSVNILLDIGYHHLARQIQLVCSNYAISCELGLLHTAKTAASTPLVYDLMELFRSDTIDAEVLRYFRSQKQPKAILQPADIARFISRVNKRLLRVYYLRDFKQCHTYRYYIELQILKFIAGVNHKTVFYPLHLPIRHEHRCQGIDKMQG